MSSILQDLARFTLKDHLVIDFARFSKIFGHNSINIHPNGLGSLFSLSASKTVLETNPGP